MRTMTWIMCCSTVSLCSESCLRGLLGRISLRNLWISFQKAFDLLFQFPQSLLLLCAASAISLFGRPLETSEATLGLFEKQAGFLEFDFLYLDLGFQRGYSRLRSQYYLDRDSVSSVP